MYRVPHSVFADRLHRIREYLNQEDLQALLVTTNDNLFMVSGFTWRHGPWERPFAAVIPRDGEPFMILNEITRHKLRLDDEQGNLFIRDYELYLEHPGYASRTYTVDQWCRLLAVKLRSRGIRKGRLAVDGCGPAALKSEMPGIEFVDATSEMIEMRQVKYPEELAIMRNCAALTDFGQDRYMERVKAGKNVAAFDHEIAALIAEEGGRLYPDGRLDVHVVSFSGPDSAIPGGGGLDCGARFEQGHGVINIIVCRLGGLTVENERTLFVGEPRTELQVKAYQVASEASIAARKQMVAGNIVANADAAAQQIIEDGGFGANILHRTGHGMGIAGHEFPADMAFNYRPFMVNEVYSCEPAIYIWGVGGFRQDETVIVGETEPEVITKRSTKLEDQIARN